MPVAKKPKKLKIQDYTMYDFIAMTPEIAGKVLFEECKKDKPNIEVIKNILEFSPVDVNMQDEDGHTALMWASWNGHTEIVKLLLERPEIKVNLQDEDGMTALMMASKEGNLETVKLLLQHPKIKVNLQDESGRTALIWASDWGQIEIIDMLLTHPKIDRNMKCNGVNTFVDYMEVDTLKYYVEQFFNIK